MNEAARHLADYHVHTMHSYDAVGTVEECVRAARDRDLHGIGVSDHIALLPQDPKRELPRALEDLQAAVADVQAAKRSHPGYVLLGIEVDYLPHALDWTRDLVGAFPFDYVIGSVHHLAEWAIDDGRRLDEWRARDVDDVYRAYFELVGQAAESGLFDILGHLDLVKKFGHLPGTAMSDEIDRLVRRVSRAGVLVELNTAGLHRPVREMYPSMTILRSLHEQGVGIVFGSDAHAPDEVGRDFSLAAAMARVAGYSHYALLRQGNHGRRAGVDWREIPALYSPVE